MSTGTSRQRRLIPAERMILCGGKTRREKRQDCIAGRQIDVPRCHYYNSDVACPSSTSESLRRSPAFSERPLLRSFLDRHVVIFQRPFAHVADVVGDDAVEDEGGVVDADEVLPQER